VRTRLLSHYTFKSDEHYGLTEETDKIKRAGEESHKTIIYFTTMWRRHFATQICTTFREFVDLTNVTTPSKFGFRIIVGYFSGRKVEKSNNPLEGERPCATALYCDHVFIVYRVKFARHIHHMLADSLYCSCA